MGQYIYHDQWYGIGYVIGYKTFPMQTQDIPNQLIFRKFLYIYPCDIRTLFLQTRAPLVQYYIISSPLSRHPGPGRATRLWPSSSRGPDSHAVSSSPVVQLSLMYSAITPALFHFHIYREAGGLGVGRLGA